MAEPTPGPWTLGKFQGTGVPILAKQGPIDVCVATAYSLPDARLIAKARHLPELVNALEAVDVWFTDLAIRPDDLEDPGPNWRSDMIRAMRAVRAALALVQDEDHG